MKNIFANIYTLLIYAFMIYLEIGGIVHSVRKHSTSDVIATVMIPPWAWYRSIELWWHDDFNNVDWDKRLSSDMSTCIYFIQTTSNEEVNIYERNENLEKFSNKLAKYPDERRESLKEGTKVYIEYNNSLYEDMINLIDGLIRNKKFNWVKSDKTLNLEKQLYKYLKAEDVEAIISGIEFITSELFSYYEDSGNAKMDDEAHLIEYQRMEEVIELQQEVLQSEIRGIYESIFNEKLKE